MRFLLLWALLLGACTPAWNWRELPLNHGVATMRMACKPAVQTRDVAMPARTAPLTMTLWACEQGGVTQAVTLADVGDPAQVGATLRMWGDAALRNFNVQDQPQRREWRVAAATPQPDAGVWTFAGRRADGAALHVQTGLVARGTWVLQATLVSTEPLPAPVVQAFFEGVAFGR